MPRANRRARPQQPDPAPVTSFGQVVQDWQGLPYIVRTVNSVPSGRSYRCPGCDQEIRGGQHLVVWREEDVEAVDRRHWHAVCWAHRDDRAPVIRRSRAAPRY